MLDIEGVYISGAFRRVNRRHGACLLTFNRHSCTRTKWQSKSETDLHSGWRWVEMLFLNHVESIRSAFSCIGLKVRGWTVHIRKILQGYPKREACNPTTLRILYLCSDLLVTDKFMSQVTGVINIQEYLNAQLNEYSVGALNSANHNYVSMRSLTISACSTQRTDH